MTSQINPTIPIRRPPAEELDDPEVFGPEPWQPWDPIPDASKESHRLRHLGILKVEWRYRPGDWVEITADRDINRSWRDLCIVGLGNDDEIVTTAGRLGPKESTVVLKGWNLVHRIRVTPSDIASRSGARTAIHALRVLYGLVACGAEVSDCGCEHELGEMWRWFDACDAAILETLNRGKQRRKGLSLGASLPGRLAVQSRP